MPRSLASAPRAGYPSGMDSTISARSVATPAAPGWRLLAFVYDLLPMIPLMMVVSAAFLWINGGQTVERAPLLGVLELLTIWTLVGAYFVLSWRRGGQTIGMRPWRLRVVAQDGTPASMKSLWLRYAVAIFTLGFGLLWALFDRDRRALYDHAAGTSFVRLQPAPKA
jgi:uncharacterized RDD family membrane protein YckC